MLAAATRSRWPENAQCGQDRVRPRGFGTRRWQAGQVDDVPRSSTSRTVIPAKVTPASPSRRDQNPGTSLAAVGCDEAGVGYVGRFGFSNRLSAATHAVQVVQRLPVGVEEGGLDVGQTVLEAVGADDGPGVA